MSPFIFYVNKMLKKFLYLTFTRKNITKIIIIFSVGLSTRIFINDYYDINVFNDYFNKISIIYYLFLSSFIVSLNNIIDTYNIYIIPNFSTIISQFKSEYIKPSFIQNLLLNVLSNFDNKFKIPANDILSKENITQDNEFKNIINFEAKNEKLISYEESYKNKSIRRVPKHDSLYDNYSSNSSLKSNKSNTTSTSNYKSNLKEVTTNEIPYNYNTTEISNNNAFIRNSNDIIFSPTEVGWSVNSSNELVNNNIITYYDPTVINNGISDSKNDDYNTPSTMTSLFEQNGQYNNQYDYYNNSYCTNNTNHGTVSTTPELNPLNSRPVYSVNWDERREPILKHLREISPILESTTQEFKLQTKSKNGHFKLGFKLLGNSANNIEKVYVKYHDIAKRKLFWNLWEKGTGNYSDYTEFKLKFDPNTSIWGEIKAATKNDISKEVSDLLRSNPFNKPSIQGRNIHSIGLTSTQDNLNRLNANIHNAHRIKDHNIKHKYYKRK